MEWRQLFSFLSIKRGKGLPFEAQTSDKSYIETTSQKPATAKKKHTSKLTAKTGENQRKWEIPRDKLAQTKNRRATQEAARQR